MAKKADSNSPSCKQPDDAGQALSPAAQGSPARDRSDKAEVERRLRVMLERLTSHGKRITPQRLAILRVLARSEGHPSVERVHKTILKDFPTTSLATVYKTIRFLAEEGQVLELEFSDMGNRYDGNKPYPHPHVICRKCGAIVDSTAVEMEELVRRITAETGYSITTHRLDFYGLCPRCRK